MAKSTKRSRARRFYGRASKSFRRRTKNKKIPILPLLGLAPTVIPIAQMAMDGRYADSLNVAVTNFTGYNVWDKQFHPEILVGTYTPVVAGFIGHMIANKLGVNRAIAKIPFAGKYISL